MSVQLLSATPTSAEVRKCTTFFPYPSPLPPPLHSALEDPTTSLVPEVMHLPSEHVHTPEACGCGYTFCSLPETLVTPTSVHSPRVVVVDCTTRRWTVDICRAPAGALQISSGKLCIEVTPQDKIAAISESLCIGCGICVKVGVVGW